jgi:hypothetical protein
MLVIVAAVLGAAGIIGTYYCVAADRTHGRSGMF